VSFAFLSSPRASGRDVEESSATEETAENRFFDLAHGVAGQRVHDLDPFGHLECGEALARDGADGLRVERDAGFGDDDSEDRLAEIGVGYADLLRARIPLRIMPALAVL